MYYILSLNVQFLEEQYGLNRTVPDSNRFKLTFVKKD